jgi:hypothetical protein
VVVVRGAAFMVIIVAFAVSVVLGLSYVSETYKDSRSSGICVYYIGDAECTPWEEWKTNPR